MFHDRDITRLYQIALLQQLFVDPVDGALLQTFNREHRHTVRFFYSYNDIAAAPIVNVVGKGADGM